jgi:hypothetical protein
LHQRGETKKNLLCKGRIKRKKITGGKNKTHPRYRGYQPIYPKLYSSINIKLSTKKKYTRIKLLYSVFKYFSNVSLTLPRPDQHGQNQNSTRKKHSHL